MSSPSFAFLALRDHPYARVMMRHLLGAGLAPSIVIEEASAVAEEERSKFLARMAGHPLPGSLQDQLTGTDCSFHSMPVHKSEALMKVLGGEDLDLIVLGGTRIIRGPVLGHPRHGVINAHPGLLPECRGSASPAWSVRHDIPIGATAHFCDDGIDTGDLLLRREFPVRRGMTYEDLCIGTTELAGQLMQESLLALEQGRWPQIRKAQGTSPWPTFRNASPEVIADVRAKLNEQRYAHYVD